MRGWLLGLGLALVLLASAGGVIAVVHWYPGSPLDHRPYCSGANLIPDVSGHRLARSSACFGGSWP
jgi:hypothetical protein